MWTQNIRGEYPYHTYPLRKIDKGTDHEGSPRIYHASPCTSFMNPGESIKEYFLRYFTGMHGKALFLLW